MLPFNYQKFVQGIAMLCSQLQANELAQEWSLLSQLFLCFGHVLNIFDSFLCVCLPTTSTYALPLFLLLLLLPQLLQLFLLCVFGQVQRGPKFVCLFDFGYQRGLAKAAFSILLSLSLPFSLWPLTSAFQSPLAWLTLIGNLAYGFFSFASLFDQKSYFLVAQGICGKVEGSSLYCSRFVAASKCNEIKLLELLFNYY